MLPAKFVFGAFKTDAYSSEPFNPSELFIRPAGYVGLLGYNLPQTRLEPGDALPVTLYWQALEPTDEDISIFLQLVAGQDQVLGQVDSYPGGGAYPTSMWSPGPASWA